MLPPPPPLQAVLCTQWLGYAYVGHPADLTVPDAQLVLPRSGVLSFCRASQQSKVVAPQQVSTLLNWVCKATAALQALAAHPPPSCLAEQQGLGEPTVLVALDCTRFRPDVSLEVPLRAVCCRLDRRPTYSHAPPGGVPMWNVHTVSCVQLPWEHRETYQQAIREVKAGAT